jgi:dTDP-4-dehydrorhamnose 3,5-epimerase-like enzyme
MAALEVPSLIEGGLAVDDRGSLAFVNGFSFDGVKRFYVVSNFQQGFIRAWHGHRHESKYVFAAAGAALVCAVAVTDWDHPDAQAKVHRYVLSSDKPAVLFIPSGYANGAMSLTEEAKLMYFSTASVDESRGDDIRFDAHYWDPWTVVER